MARELHNLLVNSIFEKELRLQAKNHLKGRLLDIGCGTKPYGELLGEYVSEHVGVDLADGVHGADSLDLHGTAYEIPVASESFDSVICTAVLEHLEEPEQALCEAARVLKPGGVALYSVPFIWHVHEAPRDFYRYSRYGLRYLFEKTGFEIVEIKALAGFWVTFSQLAVYYLYRANRGPLKLVIPLFGLAIQGWGRLMHVFDRSEEWTWMYVVIARRK